MKTTISKILGKPSDYVICTSCNKLNWYENDNCECGDKVIVPDTPVDKVANSLQVLKWIESEYEFYMKEYGYTEDDCDNINIQI